MNVKRMGGNDMTVSLSRLLLLCLSITVSAWHQQAAAQSDMSVTFPSRTLSIAQAIETIEAQTAFLVSINHTGFDVAAMVDLGEEPLLTVRTALDRILHGTGHTCVIRGNYILIIPDQEAPRPAERPRESASRPFQTDVSTAEELPEELPVHPEPVAVSVSLPGTQPVTHPGEITRHVDPTDRRRLAALAQIEQRAVNPMRVAVKANMLYGAAALAPNLGLEFRLGRRSSLDLGAGYNGWNLNGTDSDNRKLGHWKLQGEYRWWLCETFNGHFFGAHVFGGMFNIAEHDIPLLFGDKHSGQYRYEGWMAGVGISYGYQLMLGTKWNLELSAGVGYGRMKYDRYEHWHCGELLERRVPRNYFGPTRAAVTVMFLIK